MKSRILSQKKVSISEQEDFQKGLRTLITEKNFSGALEQWEQVIKSRLKNEKYDAYVQGLNTLICNQIQHYGMTNHYSEYWQTNALSYYKTILKLSNFSSRSKRSRTLSSEIKEMRWHIHDRLGSVYCHIAQSHYNKESYKEAVIALMNGIKSYEDYLSTKADACNPYQVTVFARQALFYAFAVIAKLQEPKTDTNAIKSLLKEGLKKSQTAQDLDITHHDTNPEVIEVTLFYKIVPTIAALSNKKIPGIKSLDASTTTLRAMVDYYRNGHRWNIIQLHHISWSAEFIRTELTKLCSQDDESAIPLDIRQILSTCCEISFEVLLVAQTGEYAFMREIVDQKMHFAIMCGHQERLKLLCSNNTRALYLIHQCKMQIKADTIESAYHLFNKALSLTENNPSILLEIALTGASLSALDRNHTIAIQILSTIKSLYKTLLPTLVTRNLQERLYQEVKEKIETIGSIAIDSRHPYLSTQTNQAWHALAKECFDFLLEIATDMDQVAHIDFKPNIELIRFQLNAQTIANLPPMPSPSNILEQPKDLKVPIANQIPTLQGLIAFRNHAKKAVKNLSENITNNKHADWDALSVAKQLICQYMTSYYWESSISSQDKIRRDFLKSYKSDLKKLLAQLSQQSILTRITYQNYLFTQILFALRAIEDNNLNSVKAAFSQLLTIIKQTKSSEVQVNFFAIIKGIFGDDKKNQIIDIEKHELIIKLCKHSISNQKEDVDSRFIRDYSYEIACSHKELGKNYLSAQQNDQAIEHLQLSCQYLDQSFSEKKGNDENHDLEQDYLVNKISTQLFLIKAQLAKGEINTGNIVSKDCFPLLSRLKENTSNIKPGLLEALENTINFYIRYTFFLHVKPANHNLAKSIIEILYRYANSEIKISDLSRNEIRAYTSNLIDTMKDHLTSNNEGNQEYVALIITLFEVDLCLHHINQDYLKAQESYIDHMKFLEVFQSEPSNLMLGVNNLCSMQLNLANLEDQQAHTTLEETIVLLSESAYSLFQMDAFRIGTLIAVTQRDITLLKTTLKAMSALFLDICKTNIKAKIVSAFLSLNSTVHTAINYAKLELETSHISNSRGQKALTALKIGFEVLVEATCLARSSSAKDDESLIPMMSESISEKYLKARKELDLPRYSLNGECYQSFTESYRCLITNLTDDFQMYQTAAKNYLSEYPTGANPELKKAIIRSMVTFERYLAQHYHFSLSYFYTLQQQDTKDTDVQQFMSRHADYYTKNIYQIFRDTICIRDNLYFNNRPSFFKRNSYIVSGIQPHLRRSFSLNNMTVYTEDGSSELITGYSLKHSNL